MKPFSYLDVSDISDRVERVFSEESLANANAYYDAVRNGTLTNLTDPRYEQGLKLLRVLPILAHLGFSLGEYQKTMLPFAEKLNAPDCKRTSDSYAEMFGETFPMVENFGEGEPLRHSCRKPGAPKKRRRIISRRLAKIGASFPSMKRFSMKAAKNSMKISTRIPSRTPVRI